MAFAWAEHVRSREGRLEVRNIQMAVSFWGEGSWRARGRRLPDRTFVGHAYRAPAPEWFARENPADPPESPAVSRAALERRLHATPLGRLCRNSEIRTALAQDQLAVALAPAVHLPDLLWEEERLQEEWKIGRPAAASQAAGAMEAIDQLGRSWPPEIRQLRRRLRGAALRRLDAAATGREIFRPCPSYFGEPYLPFDLAPGVSFKAGMVRRAEFWPSLESEARSRAWRADRNMVSAVEMRLFPAGPLAQDFAAAAAVWLSVAALRNFEARSPLPVLPWAAIFPVGETPPGFRIRIRPETMRRLGGSYHTLAAAALSPYVAGPFHDYCAERGENLPPDRNDLPALAAAKWCGLRPPLAHDVLQAER